MRTGNLRSRLDKIEQDLPNSGEAWHVTICYDPTDPTSPDRLYAEAYTLLWTRGYMQDQHRLNVVYLPDNGRDPGLVPPIHVQRLNK